MSGPATPVYCPVVVDRPCALMVYVPSARSPSGVLEERLPEEELREDELPEDEV